MTFAENTFLAADGKKIHYYHWPAKPGTYCRGVVQIAHGMAEHAARYDRFANFLSENGFAIFANDHRGHGQTAASLNEVGYKEEGDFWEKALGDMRSLHGLAKAKLPGVPYHLFGHSMGSFLVRHYVALHGGELASAILSGTGGDPGFLGKTGAFIARIESLFKGRKQPSPLLDMLSFGKFNRSFRPNRTSHDWLSRDEIEVDQYVADPRCGNIFTTGFFMDLLKGLSIINGPAVFRDTPKDLPIFLFAGALDPVGDCGKGVQEVFEKYKKAGGKRVEIKIYGNGRHEMLNETNREEVFRDVLAFLTH